MSNQIYYEDLKLDSEIPSLLKHPTTEQLVRWAAAADDYYPIHYDKDFAQSKGLPGVIVHGLLVACFLGQLTTDWIGKQGKLSKLSCTYRGVTFPGQDIICKGKVKKKYIDGGNSCVECEIWVENPAGEKVVLGTAVVILPT